MMSSRTFVRVLLAITFAAHAYGQACTPGSGVLKLLQLDTCRDNVAILECFSKMQMSTSQMCSIQLQPDLKIAADGTFCDISKGVQSRGLASGKYSMGRSDLDFQLQQYPQYQGMLLMNLKGRVVPAAGGRETQVDCNMLFNVTAGSALGVVSLGSDSLMSTTYTGPPVASNGYGGGYLGAVGSGPATISNGATQSGSMGMAGNGMIMPGSSGMGDNGMGQQPGGIPTDPYLTAVSSSVMAAASWCSSVLLALLLGVLLTVIG